MPVDYFKKTFLRVVQSVIPWSFNVEGIKNCQVYRIANGKLDMELLNGKIVHPIFINQRNSYITSFIIDVVLKSIYRIYMKNQNIYHWLLETNERVFKRIGKSERI